MPIRCLSVCRAWARPMSRRPRCHTCGREVSPREATHTRCGQLVHRDSEGSECECIHFRNRAECLRPQPVPGPPPPLQLHGLSGSKTHESSAQSTRSGAPRLDVFSAEGGHARHGCTERRFGDFAFVPNILNARSKRRQCRTRPPNAAGRQPRAFEQHSLRFLFCGPTRP